MTKPTNEPTLDLAKVNEPFDLATALTYLNKYGEFIRCVKGDLDFYFYKAIEKRPVLVDGQRQWVTIETIQTATQWQSAVPQFEVGLLNAKCFYLMGFKETGEPDWERPVTSLEGGTT